MSVGESESVILSVLCDSLQPLGLSMDFSRQEYWSGLPFPSPGDLPHPGIEPESLASLVLAGGFFATEPHGKPRSAVSVAYLRGTGRNIGSEIKKEEEVNILPGQSPQLLMQMEQNSTGKILKVRKKVS